MGDLNDIDRADRARDPERRALDALRLGKVDNKPSRKLDLVPWERGEVVVTFDCAEFTSHCPVTGQPDFATLSIVYSPGARLIETKSLKLFLWSFREERKFNEAICAEIADEIMRQAEPRWVDVEMRFNPRGGIAVCASVARKRSE